MHIQVQGNLLFQLHGC
uniref:Uncharacterized protein n=1 Tax=Arundo donax TaxID=35708 RepID=A0A0A8XNN5_ARUDO